MTAENAGKRYSPIFLRLSARHVLSLLSAWSALLPLQVARDLAM
jgi:hypothetical protein